MFTCVPACVCVRLYACTRVRACACFPCELCAQNSGDMSRIIKVITIEQAYVVTTFQA